MHTFEQVKCINTYRGVNGIIVKKIIDVLKY